jgi:chitin disaccharide deacetylase
MTVLAILNADDFGLSPGINRGIIAAHREGILTSASLMVVGDAFEEAVALAHAHPSLSLGVHLTLVEGVPVLPPQKIPSLVTSDGRFYGSLGTFLLRWLGRRIQIEEVQREFEAQIERARQCTIQIDKLDGHMHVHLLPGVFETVLALADHYQIPAIRLPTEGALGLDNLTAFRGYCRRAVLTSISALRKPRLAKAGRLYATRCAGIAESGRLTEEGLLRILQGLRPGPTEIMAHPGYSDSTLDNWPQSRRYKREQELAALTSPRVKALVRKHRIELVTYPEVVKRRMTP